MSLINQMLKDLENRPRHVVTSESLLAGLRTSISLQFKKNRFHYLVISILIFILIAMFLFFIYSNNMQSSLATTMRTHNTSILTTQQKDPTNLTTTDIHASDTLLTGIALQMQQDISNLRFLLNQGTLYQLSSDIARNELIIIFEKTRLVAALPKINYSGSGVEDIQAFKDENGNLKLVLRLNSTADVRRLELSEAGGESELQLDIYYKNIQEPANNQSSVNKPTIPVTIKKPVMESASEQLYQHALDLALSGQNSEAISVLTQLVMSEPSNQKAREYLANLLMLHGKKMEAANLLDEGIRVSPEDSKLYEMKAKLLVEQGRVAEALLLLQKKSPQIENDPEYYAFIAALYQRQGKTDLAAKLYRKLLSLQSSNAKWWIGLGIALDALGDHTQAFDAFSNANSIGNLSPDLKDFLENRLGSAGNSFG